MKTSDAWQHLEALRVLGDLDHPCSGKHQKEWAARIREALRKAGTVAGAAVLLKVARASFFRLISDHPELTEGIELKRRGWATRTRKPAKAAKPKPTTREKRLPPSVQEVRARPVQSTPGKPRGQPVVAVPSGSVRARGVAPPSPVPPPKRIGR